MSIPSTRAVTALRREISIVSTVVVPVAPVVYLVVVRLNLVRIRFRASDFGQVAKNKSRSCKSNEASRAEMVLLGSFFALV